jgi:peptidoglycan/xylan/chitin deacetylase (PgdA/CDA1 family)
MSMIQPCREWGFLNNRINWISRPPFWLRLLYPSVLWRAKVTEKRVFLTFDDGPVPGITPWVIDRLKDYGARASFLCVGDNIRKYPAVFERLKTDGIETGCHTFSHKPAHQMGLKTFLKDIDKGLGFHNEVTWFRPPHGVLFPWWVGAIESRGLKIVMWDLLSRDYDGTLSPSEVADNVIRHLRPGSVIVFHDSLKAWPNLKEALP